MFKSFSFLFLLFFGTNVFAQDNSAEIDKIFSWITPGSPGCACAVSQHGKVIINKAYGLADLEREVPLTTNSVFDAGSLTKQFVAAAVLLLVEEGKLSLTDDIRKHIPELHDYGHTITIDHLLTHTSGIRDWTGIMPIENGDSDALTITLRQRNLNFVPGEEWSYSNSGYVLAKEIIARLTGTPFSEFSRKQLFEKLGMASTVYLDDLRDVVKNRALAYQHEDGEWKMAMLLDNDRGGGGALFSTPGDLLIWNEALNSGALGAYVTEKIHEPAKLKNGRKLDYSRGLFIDNNDDSQAIWHTGSADGYKSMLGRIPNDELSIAIMCNSGDGTDRKLSTQRLLDLFISPSISNHEKSGGPQAYADGVDTTGIDFSSRVGLYFNEESGEAMRLIVHDGKLRIAGGPSLVELSNNLYSRWGSVLNFMSQDEFEVRFTSPDKFELKSMEGKITQYRRAKTYSPTARELEAFVGRYESEEIDAVFKVTAIENSLSVQLEHSPENKLDFKQVDTNTFQWNRMTIRFQRDKEGRPVSFDYTNPVIRNVRFHRVAGREG